MRIPPIERIPLAVYVSAFAMLGVANTSAIWLRKGFGLDGVVDALGLSAAFFVCGFPAFVLVTAAELSTRGLERRERLGRVALALLAGAALHSTGLVAFAWRTSGAIPTLESFGRYAWQCLTLGSLLGATLLFWRRQVEAARRSEALEVERLQARRELEELSLRQLRSQIEPHFLFNALASVKELHRRDPVGGRGLLASLADYLALSLSRNRMAQRTVPDELRLAKAYLEVLAVRMGPRLSVEYDVPAELARVWLPPLALATLVENAVKHGIGPRGPGGRIRIELRRGGGEITARVIDDGVGFRSPSGTGIGLANTRARLHMLYGPRASVDVAHNPGGGVVATLRIPAAA